MKTVAVISRKGGAGKTTIALHLAVAAEALGIGTAIFDLDPQASAALWSDHRGEPIPAVVPAQAPRLAGLLKQAQAQDADLVILDTPPHTDGTATDAALRRRLSRGPKGESLQSIASLPESEADTFTTED